MPLLYTMPGTWTDSMRTLTSLLKPTPQTKAENIEHVCKIQLLRPDQISSELFKTTT